MSSELDVTVIVAVYNTMPYLTECLTSLVEQSIAAEKMEIVAVDDGSTDGSTKELERFAALHPGLFTVVTQPNSGGPAGPYNRGLDLARGRYVYFVGADDYIGAEALERLVNEADQYGSDVVAGKMIGANGRKVHQGIYATTDHDVQLYDSALLYGLSNTKLFRRELIERHGLRFPEQLPVNSDQAFTFEACVRARRISVLADYTYYYAVRRDDASNVTYLAAPEVNLACARYVMTLAARLAEAGPHRDAIHRRHFAVEFHKILSGSFLELDTARQEELRRALAELADDYLTDTIRQALPVDRRLLVCLAQAGELAVLRQVVRQQAEGAVPPIFTDGDRAYLAYAGFREGRAAVADQFYEIIGDSLTRRQLSERAEVTALAWEKAPHELHLSATVAMSGPGALDAGRVRLAAVPVGAARSDTPPVGRVVSSTMAAASAGPGTSVSGRLPIGPLLDADPTCAKWAVRLLVDVAGTTYEVPVRVGPPLVGRPLAPTCGEHRGRTYRMAASASKNDRLELSAVPLARLARLRAPLRALKTVVGRK